MQSLIESIQSLDVSLLSKVIIVISIGIIHALTSQPWSVVGVSVSIYFFGPVVGVSTLFMSYTVGNILFFYVILKIDQHSNHKYPSWLIKGLSWIKKNPSYKHMISIGLPLVPTFFIKASLPISTKSLKQFMMISTGAYVILTFCNVLIYYGFLVSIFQGEFSYITLIVLCLFLVVLYFANYVKHKWF
jgi:uncharacterized membrane protein YdjX (TVP38/TMEM64 family)